MEERHAEGARVVAISGAKLARQAVRGDASSCNEKSGNLDLCLLVEGVLFRSLAIQRDVFPGHRGCDTPGSQKAPSAKRCIKTWPSYHYFIGKPIKSQKAPSAKRCIKTIRDITSRNLGVESESTERQKVH